MLHRERYERWNISETFTVFCPIACEILKLQKMNGVLSVKEQLLCDSSLKHVHHTSKTNACQVWHVLVVIGCIYVKWNIIIIINCQGSKFTVANLRVQFATGSQTFAPKKIT